VTLNYLDVLKTKKRTTVTYSGTPLRWYSHPVNKAISLLRPLYSDPRKRSVSHFLTKEPFNIATLLKWPDLCGPLVTGLTGFRCIYKRENGLQVRLSQN